MCGGEGGGGTVVWGRGATVPPVFEDERNVRRHLSFIRGWTRLAQSQRTAMSGGPAGRRASTASRASGDGQELWGPSCPSLLLQLHPLLSPQHLQVVSPLHSSLSRHRQMKNNNNKILATGTFIRAPISKRWKQRYQNSYHSYCDQRLTVITIIMV